MNKVQKKFDVSQILLCTCRLETEETGLPDWSNGGGSFHVLSTRGSDHRKGRRLSSSCVPSIFTGGRGCEMLSCGTVFLSGPHIERRRKRARRGYDL